MSRGASIAIFVGGLILSLVISRMTRSYFVLLLLPLFFLGGSLGRR